MDCRSPAGSWLIRSPRYPDRKLVAGLVGWEPKTWCASTGPFWYFLASRSFLRRWSIADECDVLKRMIVVPDFRNIIQFRQRIAGCHFLFTLTPFFRDPFLLFFCVGKYLQYSITC